MTTIATNGKSMACDLQATHSGGIKFKIETKVIELPPKTAKDLFGVKKAFVGFCGSVDAWGEIHGWFYVPEGKPPKCRGIEMMMLTDKGEIYHATNMTNWTLIKEKQFAIGSGMQFAVAAMDSGKTPLESVKVASKFDPNTGMGFKEYNL